jgi:hypothetical protein
VAPGRAAAALKGPHRYGPFKDAFRNRFMLVYGTRGDEQENAWAAAKARFDAETFWYRGNGAVDIVSDVEFDRAAAADRGVILYGNATTNAAWSTLLAASPVQVERGRIRIGARELRGDDVGALFLQPRPDSDVACVAVVGGTGVRGMRLADRMPYFVSGVGYPDLLVVESAMLSAGNAGVLAAGFFGPDWSVEHGEIMFRDALGGGR